MTYWFIIFFVLSYIKAAYAYIGPGLGVGAMMAAIGIIAAIIFTLIGFVYYPIKKLINNKKKTINDRKN